MWLQLLVRVIYLPCFLPIGTRRVLRFFCKNLKNIQQAKGGEGKILLVGDGATAHTFQKREQLKQMDWIKQPTACPEVNPVERFFQELLLKIEPAKENIKQLTLFLYIKNAIFNSFQYKYYRIDPNPCLRDKIDLYLLRTECFQLKAC